jgi:hypothetical protein
MTVMLLDDELSDEQQYHLAVLTNTCMQMLTTRINEDKRKKVNKNKMEQLTESHNAATHQVMKTLPQLLVKFKADSKVLLPLLKLADAINFSILVDNRSKKILHDLVEVVCELLLQSASKKVIHGLGTVLQTIKDKCEGEFVTSLETKLDRISRDLYATVGKLVEKAAKKKTKGSPTKKMKVESASTTDTLLLHMCRCQALAIVMEADLTEDVSLPDLTQVREKHGCDPAMPASESSSSQLHYFRFA